jgi:hypothetical protein
MSESCVPMRADSTLISGVDCREMVSAVDVEWEPEGTGIRLGLRVASVRLLSSHPLLIEHDSVCGCARVMSCLTSCHVMTKEDIMVCKMIGKIGEKWVVSLEP